MMHRELFADLETTAVAEVDEKRLPQTRTAAKKHAAAAARALRSATLEDVLRVKEEQQIWGKKAPTKDAGRISSNYTDSCVGKGGGKRKGTPTSARIQMLCFDGRDWEEIAQESLVGPQQRKKMRPGSQGRHGRRHVVDGAEQKQRIDCRGKQGTVTTAAGEEVRLPVAAGGDYSSRGRRRRGSDD
ncbi:hypothetical protein B296_00052483 [Ensete ventricosum]|uniref:Uncharacterized protein n=1 Tax=Ensete ventricosum TaxID=4639 RepID=A0A426XHX2_ENSVE|nr:hypothetical protein B296_00052483 [Ensete ventricosum]